MRKWEAYCAMRARILMFGWEFPPHNSGGLGVACQGIVRALSAYDVDITFVLPKRLPASTPYARIMFAETEGHIVGRAINSNLTPYVNAATYQGRSVEGQSIYGANLFEEVRRYAELSRGIAQEGQYDVIYAHDWLSFLSGIEAKKITGKPLIAHIHSTEFDRSGSQGVNQEVYDIERAGMEAADTVIAVSQFTKNIVVSKYGIPAEKVQVVYNGIDDETMPRPGQRRLQLQSLKDAGYSLVLFLGRITMQKGPDHLLRAAQKVIQHNPRVAFLMCGSGDMERRMMEYAAELGISQNVFFSGFLRGPDQYEAYKLADLFVMPSISEPFGITVLEAMKLQTPVLVSKQSGVSEVVAHALKVDFWDTEEFANKVLCAITHKPLRETLSQNGTVEADRLTWNRAANKINHIVHQFTT